MRPGSAIAAGCFALLSVWRFSDGEVFWAVVFAALSLAYLAVTLRAGTGRTHRAPPGVAARGPVVDGVPSAGTAALAEQHRRGWKVIAVVGLVAAGLTVVWFPPLSLLLAGCAAYSAHRASLLGRPASWSGRSNASTKPSTR